MDESRRSPLRVNAYVMLADPSFLRESLTSYYHFVDRIVLSFDRAALSWTGTPLPIEQCLRIVEELDVEGKCVAAPGHFAFVDRDPLENDTFQRQHALDIASADADWVLQLDTDEVLLEPQLFFDCLARAHAAGSGGMDFPAMWLYSRVSPGRYLERSGRFWKRAASYPGPLAVRPGTRLSLARQTDVDLYRVDIQPANSDPWHPRQTVVDEAIAPGQAVAHFSWVRHPDVMRRKFGWSGHAEDLRPPSVYRAWAWRTRHPRIAVATSVFRPLGAWYRLSRFPEPPGGEPIEVQAR
ncbi:hypothetical protein [uncultured Microbacterium sp.]|uniref:hypothetical protein n=1 Tax=uncultured Microbacterium sp. TaxID=191216 RepID=UPI0028D5FDFC|nr:hypothetical protein [uncultured Microbacterium sp.]